MLTKELINTITSSTWCTLPNVWDYTLRSNRFLKLLDLNLPGTYGIHVAYHLLHEYVNYVLIVLPKDYDTSNLISADNSFEVGCYDEGDYKHLVFYRKELGNG